MEKSHVFLEIAGLLIDFNTRYPEYVRWRCGKYLAAEHTAVAEFVPESAGKEYTGSATVLHLEASEADIRESNRDNVGEMEAELFAMTIPYSEQCPQLGRLMTHGVAIECDGKGFIFTAESGVGKSTHAFLWQKYLGADRVHIINGDKPILWFYPDGEILACGSPWSGKEHLDENVHVPLKGICLLTRLENAPGFGITVNAPFIERATREEAFSFLLHQVFIPVNPQMKVKTLTMLEQLYELVPIYHLYINMSSECVKVSAECLLNEIVNVI